MNARILRFCFIVALVLAGIYLTQVDYSSKLETDVSSLLPQVETEEARVARRLISEEQGRAVYLELSGLPIGKEDAAVFEKIVLERLQGDSIVGSVVKLDQKTHLDAFKIVANHRLELLFPKWMEGKRESFLEERSEGEDFFKWAAISAVEDMDVFLESPSAMELARPELMDPLLLNISNLIALNENESGGFASMSSDMEEGVQYYWLTLAEPPLSPITQETLEILIDEIEKELIEKDSGLQFKYGGLVKLAGASRERIQGDIFKINLLSVLGVFIVSSVLLRKPWMLLLTVPTLLAGVIGAMSVLFLVFDQVNIIVLIVGAILIGTAIDYAIHLIFTEKAEADFPTRKLITYACLSTVVGFFILLFADLILIRQIGVFVGAGLLCAYLMARLSIGSKSRHKQMALRGIRKTEKGRAFVAVVACAVILVGGWGLFGLEWKDDIHNLEAPDNDLVQEDLALRERLGSNSTGSLFLITGNSYLDVFEKEEHLMELVSERFPGKGGFGVSKFLPSRSEIESIEMTKAELPRFFDALSIAFEDGGYAIEEFGDFFISATSFVEALRNKSERYEILIEDFANGLKGPMAGVIGESDGHYWSLSSLNLSTEEAIEISSLQEEVTLFSQLSFLNKTLDKHRKTLLFFGVFAMLFVAGVILFAFGGKKGGLVVFYPFLGGGVAIGICALLFGELNMFHLIGCFLGGAIALDYALFAIESYSRASGIPHSVWLSAGTTTASFLALSFSAIPVVQSLGMMVALLACVTLLLLHVSRAFLTKSLHE